jgi:presenilin-like A22 family membrane protease
MKHTMQVTAILIAVFFFIQVFGLYALGQTMNVSTGADGTVNVDYSDTAVGERPDIQGAASLLYILSGILIGTALIMLFVRLGQVKLWKAMYFLALWLASTITIGVFTASITFGIFSGALLAAVAALIISLIEVFRTNVFIHNLTEVLIYPGIAILFAPLFSIEWAIVLMIAISIYDMYAVWKSGHMVKLAKFQTSSKAFAGFVIPYSTGKAKGLSALRGKIPKGVKGAGVRTAILGGGDIAFPLVFAGVVMGWLVSSGTPMLSAFLQSTIISAFAALFLLLLFVRAEKEKFYPAMPFITAGCFVGLGVVWALGLLI